MDRIYLASPHMGSNERKYVEEAFASNWIAPLGPQVSAFEERMKEYIGIKAAVALSSGTAGIHLAIKALGIKEGDIVFCSSMTFAASCNPIKYEKARPVFIDSEPNSWNMSPKALMKAFQKYKPKAVIVVHLYGQPAKMDEIMEICNMHHVPVIEDAAESLGAIYKGKKTGSIGRLGVFSFNGNKIITTSGGGMLVSDDEELIDKARFWATQAREPFRHYEHQEIGYNYRLSNICAAIGKGQMEILEERIAKKKEIFNTYRDAFKDIDEIQMMPICQESKSNYWLSCITLTPESRVRPLEIIEALEKENIESRPIWKPMHMQPIYKEEPFFSHYEGEMSVSEDIFNRGVCLPSDTKMTKEDIERVINCIKGLF